MTHIEDILLDDLLLPGDGDGAGAELGVEVLVRLVQTDSLHRGELLDVQNILTEFFLCCKNIYVWMVFVFRFHDIFE